MRTGPIGLLDPGVELVQLLRIAIRSGPGINRIRFSKNAINGHFIEGKRTRRVLEKVLSPAPRAQ